MYLHFQIVQTRIRELLQEPSHLGLNYLREKNYMDSLQWTIGLKGFGNQIFLNIFIALTFQ